jgi:hypothetical protein
MKFLQELFGTRLAPAAPSPNIAKQAAERTSLVGVVTVPLSRVIEVMVIMPGSGVDILRWPAEQVFTTINPTFPIGNLAMRLLRAPEDSAARLAFAHDSIDKIVDATASAVVQTKTLTIRPGGVSRSIPVIVCFCFHNDPDCAGGKQIIIADGAPVMPR